MLLMVSYVRDPGAETPAQCRYAAAKDIPPMIQWTGLLPAGTGCFSNKQSERDSRNQSDQQVHASIVDQGALRSRSTNKRMPYSRSPQPEIQQRILFAPDPQKKKQHSHHAGCSNKDAKEHPHQVKRSEAGILACFSRYRLHVIQASRLSTDSKSLCRTARFFPGAHAPPRPHAAESSCPQQA